MNVTLFDDLLLQERSCGRKMGEQSRWGKQRQVLEQLRSGLIVACEDCS